MTCDNRATVDSQFSGLKRRAIASASVFLGSRLPHLAADDWPEVARSAICATVTAEGHTYSFSICCLNSPAVKTAGWHAVPEHRTAKDFPDLN